MSNRKLQATSSNYKKMENLFYQNIVAGLKKVQSEIKNIPAKHKSSFKNLNDCYLIT